MHHHTKAGYNKRQSGSESIFYELMMLHYPIKFGYKKADRVVQRVSSTSSWWCSTTPSLVTKRESGSEGIFHHLTTAPPSMFGYKKQREWLRGSSTNSWQCTTIPSLVAKKAGRVVLKELPPSHDNAPPSKFGYKKAEKVVQRVSSANSWQCTTIPSLVTKKQREWCTKNHPPSHDDAPPSKFGYKKADKVVQMVSSTNSWQCTTLPSLVTKKLREWFRRNLPPAHDNVSPYQVWLQKGRERGSECIFHLAHDNAPPYQVWLWKGRKRGSDSECIFHWLMMTHHHTKFGYKRAEKVVQRVSSTSSWWCITTSSFVTER